MKPPLISVVIVTYNCASYLKACLNSVLQTEYKNLEIIIVDNNSSDGTIKIIKSFKEKIISLFSEINLGYAKGNNMGIEKAKGEFIFLLNPDTEVDKKIFTFLLKSFADNPKIAVSQPAVYLMKDRNHLNLTGKITHFLGFDWVKDYRKSVLPKTGEIMSFSGCGVMIKKNILKRTEVFDENYFMYYEDSDLSWRIRLFGYKIVFVSKAIMFHDYKYIPVETYQSLKNKLFFNERNRIMTIYKNYNTRTILLLLPAFVILEFSMLIFSLFDGWFKEKLLGYVSIIKLRAELNKSRAFVQKNRVLTDKQVTNDFMSRLNTDIYNNWGVKKFINPFLFCYWNVISNLIR